MEVKYSFTNRDMAQGAIPDVQRSIIHKIDKTANSRQQTVWGVGGEKAWVSGEEGGGGGGRGEGGEKKVGSEMRIPVGSWAQSVASPDRQSQTNTKQKTGSGEGEGGGKKFTGTGREQDE
jgi:hypothetical protein